MPIGGPKEEHFSCFHSSCQLRLTHNISNLLITIGDCDVIDNNYIGSYDTTSEFGCFIECVTTEDCNYYNWFTDLYHRDACALFSVCDAVSPCSYHGVHISWHNPCLFQPPRLLERCKYNYYKNKQYIS